MNAKSKRFQITRPTRKGGRVRKNATRGQPEASVNTKHIFFLDIDRALRPPEISIQFHMVSYCSTIKCYSATFSIATTWRVTWMFIAMAK